MNRRPNPTRSGYATWAPIAHPVVGRRRADPPQRRRVAGVEPARDVGAGDDAEHRLVVAERPRAERLTEIAVEVDGGHRRSVDAQAVHGRSSVDFGVGRGGGSSAGRCRAQSVGDLELGTSGSRGRARRAPRRRGAPRRPGRGRRRSASASRALIASASPPSTAVVAFGPSPCRRTGCGTSGRRPGS